MINEKIKVIGRFKENYPTLMIPSINELISDVPLENKKEILNYLKSAKVISAAPGKIIDIIKNETINIQLLMYSDGEFAWRSDTIYYFENYNLDLGNEFVNHIKKKIKSIPNTIEMIKKMRNGEKISCPKCNGFISAVGNPKTTSLFKCNTCDTSMLLTKKKSFN